jgi:hypothetical protein
MNVVLRVLLSGSGVYSNLKLSPTVAILKTRRKRCEILQGIRQGQVASISSVPKRRALLRRGSLAEELFVVLRNNKTQR